jgi:hypothetical protein
LPPGKGRARHVGKSFSQPKLRAGFFNQAEQSP